MKAIYLQALVIFFAVPQFLFAQPPAIQWQKSLGSSGAEFCYAVQQTADGGYITAGESVGTDGDVSGNHGASDFWIVKLTSAGAIEWQKCLGGSKFELDAVVQQTADGGYIVAGTSQSNDGDVSGHHGVATNYDYWVVKLSSIGAIEWQKCYGGSGRDEAKSVRQTKDGGYVVVGTSESIDGDITGNHGSAGDLWVLKLSSTGTLEWQKCLGGNYADNGSCIQQTTDGGYVVTGSVSSVDGDVTGTHGDYDYWLVKLSNSGTIEWQKTLGGSNNDKAKFVQQTADGGFVINGSSWSNNGDVSGHHGPAVSYNNDAWVVKLTSIGNIEWEKSFGGEGDDFGWCINQASDGGYIVGGNMSGLSPYTGFWIAKLNTSGNVQWQQSASPGIYFVEEVARSIQQTADGGYIASGDVPFDMGENGSHGGSDYFIIKFGPDATLPVHLFEFDAQSQRPGIVLNWKTSAGQNASYFNVQRSIDGFKFNTIGKVNAGGSGTSKQAYTFTDNTFQLVAISGHPLFYRLQSIGKDGKDAYSRVVPVVLQEKGQLSVTQNPVKEILRLQYESSVATKACAEILSVNGSLFITKNMELKTGLNKISIPAGQLAAGTYLVRITQQNQSDTKRFIKQ